MALNKKFVPTKKATPVTNVEEIETIEDELFEESIVPKISLRENNKIQEAMLADEELEDDELEEEEIVEEKPKTVKKKAVTKPKVVEELEEEDDEPEEDELEEEEEEIVEEKPKTVKKKASIKSKPPTIEPIAKPTETLKEKEAKLLAKAKFEDRYVAPENFTKDDVKNRLRHELLQNEDLIFTKVDLEKVMNTFEKILIDITDSQDFRFLNTTIKRSMRNGSVKKSPKVDYFSYKAPRIVKHMTTEVGFSPLYRGDYDKETKIFTSTHIRNSEKDEYEEHEEEIQL